MAIHSLINPPQPIFHFSALRFLVLSPTHLFPLLINEDIINYDRSFNRKNTSQVISIGYTEIKHILLYLRSTFIFRQRSYVVVY